MTHSVPHRFSIDSRLGSASMMTRPHPAGMSTAPSDHFQTGTMRPMIGRRAGSASASNELGPEAQGVWQGGGGGAALAYREHALSSVAAPLGAYTLPARGRARPGSSSGRMQVYSA